MKKCATIITWRHLVRKQALTKSTTACNKIRNDVEFLFTIVTSTFVMAPTLMKASGIALRCWLPVYVIYEIVLPSKNTPINHKMQQECVYTTSPANAISNEHDSNIEICFICKTYCWSCYNRLLLLLLLDLPINNSLWVIYHFFSRDVFWNMYFKRPRV